MERLLIVVDMQNDFIDGSLANPAAQAIIEPMVEYIKNFDGDICYTYDIHKDNYLHTLEGKNLPIPHCISGTDGWLVNSQIFDAADWDKTYVFSINKETFGYIDWKTKNLEKYDEIIMAGTCTDICVISNALILKATYPEIPIKVIANLCAGLTPEKHEAALEVMRSCQIEVI